MKGRDGERDKPPRSQEWGWPAATWKRPGCLRPPAPAPKQAAPGEAGCSRRWERAGAGGDGGGEAAGSSGETKGGLETLAQRPSTVRRG